MVSRRPQTPRVAGGVGWWGERNELGGVTFEGACDEGQLGKGWSSLKRLAQGPRSNPAGGGSPGKPFAPSCKLVAARGRTDADELGLAEPGSWEPAESRSWNEEENLSSNEIKAMALVSPPGSRALCPRTFQTLRTKHGVGGQPGWDSANQSFP